MALRGETMYERVLQQMRECIRTRQYVMTIHATDEMYDDNLSIFDVESAVLTGQITERQKDSTSGEWKYVLKGRTMKEENIFVIGKISPVNKLVMITVFRE
jgi:hypothetical protein